MAVIEEIEEGDVPLSKEDMARLLQVNKVVKNSSCAYSCPKEMYRYEDRLNFRTTPSL